MGQMIYFGKMVSRGRPSIFADGLHGRENKRKPRTELKRMLGMSPGDIKHAFDIVEDLILESYQGCTNALWKEHLRALVVQYARWRCEEGQRWESP